MIKTSLFAGAPGRPPSAVSVTPRCRVRRRCHPQRKRLDPLQALSRGRDRSVQEDPQGIKINYGGGGSGKGRQDLSDTVVDFAGSDSPFKEADLAKAKGGAILYFPILLSPISVSYNVAGVDKLQLSAPVIAKIFQREITKWNDKAIAAENPGVKLPDTDHRGRPSRRRLGHHPELHRIPERRGQGRLEAQERLDRRVAERHAGGTGELAASRRS